MHQQLDIFGTGPAPGCRYDRGLEARDPIGPADRAFAREAMHEPNSFRAIFDCVNDGIFVCDAAAGTVIDVNRPGCKMFDASRHELVGRQIEALSSGVPPYDQRAAMQKIERALRGEPQIFEWHCRAQGDRLFWAEVSIHRASLHGADVVLAVVRDITERKEAEAQLQRIAHTDALTGLANRTAFLQRIGQALETSRAKLAVLYVDLDRFKDVNDTLGRGVGDRILQLVAERIVGAMRRRDLLARFGSDEFGIVLNRRGAVRIARFARKLLDAVATPFVVDGHECHIGLSIGIACCDDESIDAETLLARADIALYRAKSEGRGTFAFFTAEMDRQVRSRVTMTAELRDAAIASQLHLAYQPQARMDGELTGFEALVRWDHPRLGAVEPAAFVPLAEDSMLILPIGEWILRQACREAASWQQKLQIAVNVSPVQFRHGDLPDLVHTILRQTGLEANRLELEITERVLIGDFPRAVAVLRRLKALGLRIALDDFGVGYSSLAYLQSFRFDRIKIDASFVANLERNPRSAAIIRAVLALGRGLGVPVTAEGVETKRQRVFLSREGCDGVQGHLIGRPLPIAQYAHWIGCPEPAFQI